MKGIYKNYLSGIKFVDRRELFDKELTRFAKGFFHIRIGKPGSGETEECACEHSQERCALAIRENRRKQPPIHLAEKLGKAVQTNGAHANQSPQQPMQRLDAAIRHCVNETKEKDRRINGNITFTQRHFVANSFVPCELARLQSGISRGVVKVFQASHLVEGGYIWNARLLQRIISLLAKQEE